MCCSLAEYVFFDDQPASIDIWCPLRDSHQAPAYETFRHRLCSPSPSKWVRGLGKTGIEKLAGRKEAGFDVKQVCTDLGIWILHRGGAVAQNGSESVERSRHEFICVCIIFVIFLLRRMPAPVLLVYVFQMLLLLSFKRHLRCGWDEATVTWFCRQ